MPDELDDIRILVLDRGHVFICRCPDPKTTVFWITVTHCRTIRNWGTTEGLGQLYNGPTESTVLDAIVPEHDIPIRAILDVFKVKEDEWAKHLKLTKSA